MGCDSALRDPTHHAPVCIQQPWRYVGTSWLSVALGGQRTARKAELDGLPLSCGHSHPPTCVLLQVGETEPFICELLTNLTGIIQDLETHQIHMFYETVGLMISAETVPEKRDEYVVRARPARACGTAHRLQFAACCAM